MADDIDDLLDEIETKFVAKDKRIDDRVQKARTTRRQSEDEMDKIIDDICGDTEPEVKCNRSQYSNDSFKKHPSASKCFPVYLGGSSHSTGLGSSFNKRACDKLRCTSCDFKVVSFDNFEWHPSTDYLFLRNHVPEFDRLKKKLVRKKGWRAYCCQCSSCSVSDVTDLKDFQLKWVCGKH